MPNGKSAARKRRSKKNRRYGEIVKLAAEISGRSKSMVYSVLSYRSRSAAVTRAILEAKQRILDAERAQADMDSSRCAA